MAWSDWVALLALDLTAIPILIGVQQISHLLNGITIAVVGIVVCSIVAFFGHRFFRNARNPFLGFFVLASFSCVVDLLLGLETIGVIRGRCDLWLTLVEQYLNTSWGACVNIYDATVHFALYYKLIADIKIGLDHKASKYGLLWAGSILNSMVVLLSSAIFGPYPVRPGIILNIPYFIIPFVYLVKELRKPAWEGSETSRVDRLLSLTFAILFWAFSFSTLGVGARQLKNYSAFLPWTRFRLSSTSQFAQTLTNTLIISPLYVLAFITPAQASWKLTFVAHGFLLNSLVTQLFEHLGIRHFDITQNLRRPPLSATVFFVGLALVFKGVVFKRPKVGQRAAGSHTTDDQHKLADKMV